MDKFLDRLIEAVKTGEPDEIAESVKELSMMVQLQFNDPDSIAARIKDALRKGLPEFAADLANRFSERLQSNPVTVPRYFKAELKNAVDHFDRARAKILTQQLIRYHRSTAQPYPAKCQNEIMTALQRKRYFDLISALGEAFMLRKPLHDVAMGQTDLKYHLALRRQYAQSLIESGHLSAALPFLHNLADRCHNLKEDGEWAEAIGLTGRVHKQIYMDVADEPMHSKADYRANLEQSIDLYRSVYKDDKTKVWHGINAIALIQRSVRDGVGDRTLLTQSKKWAKDIESGIAKRLAQREKKAEIENKEETDEPWDLATAAEACIAIGDLDKALEWVVRYAESPSADAFEYASTLRQFEQVWQLDNLNKKHAIILQVLRSALLKQNGGAVQIANAIDELNKSADLKHDGNYERVLGRDRYLQYGWYMLGVERAQAVAKIEDTYGDGIGTGFLMRGTDISPRIADKWVLLTNAHVISSDHREQASSPASLTPDRARVRFQAGRKTDKTLRVKDIIYSSPRNELDCSIISLQSPLASTPVPYRVASTLPLPGPEANNRVYVIGHPRGGGLSFSLHDNLLLGCQDPKVHYRAPTEGGSSGSPVFNASWELIALHHLGGRNLSRLDGEPGTYEANEGIMIGRILNAVRAELG